MALCDALESQLKERAVMMQVAGVKNPKIPPSFFDLLNPGEMNPEKNLSGFFKT